jgi:putative hydrolase of the HAD superfamily
MAAVTESTGENPLFALEVGRMSEDAFLDGLGEQLTDQLGRPVDLHKFGERYFETLDANQAMIDYMRELQARGYKLAICTNNVREWEARWRAMLPVDEIFDDVIDSAFVGVRKPDRRIYEIALERLDVAPAQALFIDDLELNCEAARELGLAAVWFQSTEQAIEEIEALLSQFSAPSRSQQ